ncbi:MAG: DnaD domain protein [Veillonellales bacterium]
MMMISRAHEEEPEEKTPDEIKVKEIYSVIEKEFGPVRSGLEADFINDMIDHFPRDWIIEAIRKAVLNKARNTNYVIKILNGWRSEGFTNSDKPWEAKSRGKPATSRFSKKSYAGSSSPSQVDWENEPSTLGGSI